MKANTPAQTISTINEHLTRMQEAERLDAGHYSEFSDWCLGLPQVDGEFIDTLYSGLTVREKSKNIVSSQAMGRADQTYISEEGLQDLETEDQVAWLYKASGYCAVARKGDEGIRLIAVRSELALSANPLTPDPIETVFAGSPDTLGKQYSGMMFKKLAAQILELKHGDAAKEVVTTPLGGVTNTRLNLIGAATGKMFCYRELDGPKYADIRAALLQEPMFAESLAADVPVSYQLSRLADFIFARQVVFPEYDVQTIDDVKETGRALLLQGWDLN